MLRNVVSFFEANMRILALCERKPLTRTGVCKVLTGFDTDTEGRVARRLNDLVERGLLECKNIGLQKLNGEFRNSRKYYVMTDRGAQALFYFKQCSQFYNKPLEASA